MSNNAPDYKDNLYFEPIGDMSKLKIAEEALEFIIKTIPADKWIGEKDLEDCYKKAEKALAKMRNN